MTMPAAAQETEVSYPRIVLMATDAANGDSPVSWGVGDPHPYHKTMKVVAMYIRGDMVEIYSFDGANGLRESVPKMRTRLIREEMPPEVFRDELAHAEAGYPDDDIEDDDPDEPDPVSGEIEQPQVVTPPNGQAQP